MLRERHISRRRPRRHGAPRRRAEAIGTLLLLVLASSGAVSSVASATASRPPANRTPPQIEGTAEVGRILQASTGRWRQARDAVYAFQWRRCDSAGAACTDVEGATDRIYTVRAADVGATIVLRVAATNTDGTTAAVSKPTKVVKARASDAPIAKIRPTITGKTEPGSTLTAQSGTWQGAAPISFDYTWRRCSPLGGACVELAQTRQVYVVSTKDKEHTLRVLVRAKNSVGTSAALSDATPLVPGAAPTTPPKSTSPPVVSGVAAQGRTLTASSGSWTGSTPISFAYQWRRCDKNGSGCSSISNATQQTYALSDRDVGRTVRIRVTARNSAGSSSATSDRTPVVAGAAAPVNTSSPTISGTARVGSTLTASPGTWKGSQPIDFAYQWLRCGSGGGGCSSIASATSRTRKVTSADAGRTLRVRVAASNKSGSSVVLSAATAVIASSATAPANTSAPVLSGAARQGARLSLSSGSWSGAQPISYAYRWERCDASGGNCRAIAGATGTTYVLARADVGSRLRGVVTARNANGSSSAGSNATAVVVGPPVSTSLPKISGAPVEGRTLFASPGGWRGVGPITYGYQWTRCNAAGQFSSCSPIVVTSRPSYTLRAADVGRRVFVQVRAKNAYGASFVNSGLTGVVSAAPIATVTIRATRGVVVYGKAVTLVGRVVGAPTGERVTIVMRPVRRAIQVRPNAAVVGPGGTWRFVVRPSIGTTYQAQFRGRTSAPVRVQVRPRLLLRKASGGRMTLRVFAARSFAGKTAFVQRWNANRRRWVSVQRIRLRASRPSTVTVATIRTRVPRGTRVRVVLPGGRAGPGYVTGTSNIVRR